jgi:putative ABC transport system permease protein
MFDSLAFDIRFAFRRLRKRRTYTLLTVLTLALGVAGTAAVYSIAKRLLLDPLPVRDEHEIVVFWFEGSWSEHKFGALRPSMTDFQSAAIYRPTDATLQLGTAPARLLTGAAGSAELFDVLGVKPKLGSGFQRGDDRAGSEPKVVLSESLWRELGGRADMIGEQLELSGVARTVVGVMPEGFWFPDPAARLWLLEDLDPGDDSGNYGIVARLPPGRTLAAMAPQLERLSRELDERWDFPAEWDLSKDPYLVPLRERLLGPVRPAVLALLAAMALLLLVACVDVAALMLGQVDSRSTELAMRSALGAGRWAMLQQLAVEALAIGSLAGLAGAALAFAGFRFLVRSLPLGALAEATRLDWTLFAAAMVVAVAAATAVAAVPGLVVAQADPQRRLSRSRTGGVAGRGGRLEHGLVVGQVALVLLLTAGAALLLRSVANQRAIDTGVDVEGVAVVDVELPLSLDAAEIPVVLRRVVAAVEELPGVESAAVTQRLPLRGSSDNWGIDVESQPDLDSTTTAFRVVSPGYFRTLGIAVESGRGLLETDRTPGVEEGTVVINRELARAYFGGRDPLGQRIAFMDRWDRIVGVVDNVAEGELSADPVPARYQVHEQVPFLLSGQTVVLRAKPGLSPASLLDPARTAIQAAAPAVAVRELTTMANVATRALGPALQVMSLLSLLAGLALALGVVGIHGVVSHFVSRRKRDWGIRMVLGMRPSRVAGQIVGRGGLLVAGGIAVGGVAFFALARLLSGFLYGVGAADPLALLAAAGVLVVAGLLAAALPARRASKVDPAVVLRDQ